MIAAPPTLKQLQRWLGECEDEHLEFKEAGTQFDRDKLTRYCVALANEGGGHIVLGVTDKRPRQVRGTKAFQDLSGLMEDQSHRVHLRIHATELIHPDGRVVVVTIPSRPIGTPMEYKGAIHVVGKTRGALWFSGPPPRAEGARMTIARLRNISGNKKVISGQFGYLNTFVKGSCARLSIAPPGKTLGQSFSLIEINAAGEQ